MTFEITRESYKHNKTPLIDLENHQAQPKTLRKTKPHGSTTLPTKTIFSELQTPSKSPKNNPISIFNNCTLYDHKREFHRFQKIFALKNSQIVMKFNMLIFSQLQNK